MDQRALGQYYVGSLKGYNNVNNPKSNQREHVGPDLVDNDFDNKIQRVIQYQNKKKKEFTYKKKISVFYNKYIQPHKYLILFLIIVAAFLYYRHYYVKKAPVVILTPVETQKINNKINNLTTTALTLKQCGHSINYPCICIEETNIPVASNISNMSESINNYINKNPSSYQPDILNINNANTFNPDKLSLDNSSYNPVIAQYNLNNSNFTNPDIPSYPLQYDTQYPKTFSEPYKQWQVGDDLYRSFETPFQE